MRSSEEAIGARWAGAEGLPVEWLSTPVLLLLLVVTAVVGVAELRGDAGTAARTLASVLAAATALLVLRTWATRREPVDLGWALAFLLLAVHPHVRAGWGWIPAAAAAGVGLLLAHRASGRDARRDGRRLVVVVVPLLAARLVDAVPTEGAALVLLSVAVAVAAASTRRELALSRP